MKSIKTHSVKSVRSLKSVRSRDGTPDERGVLEFDECLITACKKFACPCPEIVKKQDTFYELLKKRDVVKYKKITIVTNNEDTNVNQAEKTNKFSVNVYSSNMVQSDTVIVEAIYNNLNQLLEIGMKNIKCIPRLLMQVIGKVVPYFLNLTKIYMKQCHIDVYTVYELSKMLPLTTVTDVCLDGSPLPEGNYAILLNASCHLNHISLSRCLVNDEVCGQIASKLHYLDPSGSTLMTINLSSNSITDVGVKLLAEALRTNRCLRYLNLADNRITDSGALALFESLMEFPLSCEETLNKKQRYMEYLKARQALLGKYLNEWDSNSMDKYNRVSKKSVTKKKTSATSLKSKHTTRKHKPDLQSITDDNVFLKAETLAAEVMGPFTDPFSNTFINRKDNYSYCVGNMALCYLNLSYNNLTFLSLKKLYSVLLYQANQKKFDQPGLIKVLIDGNYMPNNCTEIYQINEIMNNNIYSYGARLYGDLGMKKKSRTAKY